MTEPYPIRPIAEDEFDAFHRVDEHAFHGSPLSADERVTVLSRFEFDRSLAAFDAGTAVGIAATYSMRMRLPGVTAPVAGVSWVGVLPSHRRRGILSRLMRRQLTDIAAHGEAVAALWASEAGIYSRYGYGRASWHAAFTVRRGESALAADAAADPGLRLRLTEPEQARPELAKVYDTVLETRPGFLVRTEPWWDRVLYDPEDRRKGASPLRCVLAEDDSGPRGYALYAGVGAWEDETFLPDSSISVRELVTADPAASAALWRDLLGRDLSREVRALLRPVDDPVLFQLADPRRLRPVVSDGLWIRIVDLPAALAQRRYARPVDVVLEVSDPLFPGNEGRWRLRAADTGQATCERVSGDADVSLGITQLGAAYLGGTRLGMLAGAGLVTELRPGTLAPLSTAMSWEPAPWCPIIF
ncbi:MAG TPA: GNAT family N-acetyltransferase [Streptosporangiaceae bacterium]|nr:GNAT family N-acetyltransferase [Streptosporangiaceae bacterium]